MAKLVGKEQHAKERMKERFKVNLTGTLSDEIKRRIREDKPRVMRQQDNNRTVYRMVVQNRLMDIVYCWRTNRIVTVTPISLELYGPRTSK